LIACAVLELAITRRQAGVLKPSHAYWCVFTARTAPLQGPLLLAEMSLKKRWRAAGWPSLNIWLARALTCGLLVLIAGPLFFRPVEVDSRLAQTTVAAVQDGFRWLKETCSSLGASISVLPWAWRPRGGWFRQVVNWVGGSASGPWPSSQVQQSVPPVSAETHYAEL
jgi:hypothetical protein